MFLTVVRQGTARVRNLVAIGGGNDYVVGVDSAAHFIHCTIPKPFHLRGGDQCRIEDSIVGQLRSGEDAVLVQRSALIGEPPTKGAVKVGKGCISRDPQFRDPKNLDYRLKKTSPCRGKASDGGDIGCRYTPEMLEMLKLAHELRRKGVIKF